MKGKEYDSLLTSDVSVKIMAFTQKTYAYRR